MLLGSPKHDKQAKKVTSPMMFYQPVKGKMNLKLKNNIQTKQIGTKAQAQQRIVLKNQNKNSDTSRLINKNSASKLGITSISPQPVDSKKTKASGTRPRTQAQQYSQNSSLQMRNGGRAKGSIDQSKHKRFVSINLKELDSIKEDTKNYSSNLCSGRQPRFIKKTSAQAFQTFGNKGTGNDTGGIKEFSLKEQLFQILSARKSPRTKLNDKRKSSQKANNRSKNNLSITPSSPKNQFSICQPSMLSNLQTHSKFSITSSPVNALTSNDQSLSSKYVRLDQLTNSGVEITSRSVIPDLQASNQLIHPLIQGKLKRGNLSHEGILLDLSGISALDSPKIRGVSEMRVDNIKRISSSQNQYKSLYQKIKQLNKSDFSLSLKNSASALATLVSGGGVDQRTAAAHAGCFSSRRDSLNQYYNYRSLNKLDRVIYSNEPSRTSSPKFGQDKKIDQTLQAEYPITKSIQMRKQSTPKSSTMISNKEQLVIDKILENDTINYLPTNDMKYKLNASFQLQTSGMTGAFNDEHWRRPPSASENQNQTTNTTFQNITNTMNKQNELGGGTLGGTSSQLNQDSNDYVNLLTFQSNTNVVSPNRFQANASLGSIHNCSNQNMYAGSSQKTQPLYDSALAIGSGLDLSYQQTLSNFPKQQTGGVTIVKNKKHIVPFKPLKLHKLLEQSQSQKLSSKSKVKGSIDKENFMKDISHKALIREHSEEKKFNDSNGVSTTRFNSNHEFEGTEEIMSSQDETRRKRQGDEFKQWLHQRDVEQKNQMWHQAKQEWKQQNQIFKDTCFNNEYCSQRPNSAFSVSASIVGHQSDLGRTLSSKISRIESLENPRSNQPSKVSLRAEQFESDGHFDTQSNELNDTSGTKMFSIEQDSFFKNLEDNIAGNFSIKERPPSAQSLAAQKQQILNEYQYSNLKYQQQRLPFHAVQPDFSMIGVTDPLSRFSQANARKSSVGARRV